MIKFQKLEQSDPYQVFKSFYSDALKMKQNNIEALCVSSFSEHTNEVSSRYVNLKYIINDRWIFFSNYNSNKSLDFKAHKQVSGLLYWNSINVQIRIKGLIEKTSADFSDEHFKKRSLEKNILAISSNQSQSISSYDHVVRKYKNTLKMDTSDLSRPEYWGGYCIKPYYFEFWEGHKSRLNKRDVYQLKENNWEHSVIQP